MYLDAGCCEDECPDETGGTTGPCTVGVCFSYWCAEGCLNQPQGTVAGTMTITDLVDSTVYGPIDIVCSGDNGGGGTILASGCCTVNIPADGLPRDFQVAYTGTFPDAPSSPFTITISNCNGVTLNYGAYDDTLTLHIYSNFWCGIAICGATVSYLLEESDDGETYVTLASGSGTLTCPTSDGAELTVTGLPKPSKPLVRWTTVTTPPPGWRAALPGTITGEYIASQHGFGFPSCRPDEISIVAQVDFDDENYLCTPCGPIPRQLCWGGNGGLTVLTYDGTTLGAQGCAGVLEANSCVQSTFPYLGSLGSWVGTESFSATAYPKNPTDGGCGSTGTTATVSATIRACIHVFEGHYHWTVKRCVPVCDDGGGGITPIDPGPLDPGDPGGIGGGGTTCDAPFVTAYKLRSGAFEDGAIACGIGYSGWQDCDAESAWGPTGTMPSSLVNFFGDFEGCDLTPYPPCGGPAQTYTGGTIYECPSFGMAAPVMAPVVFETVKRDARVNAIREYATLGPCPYRKSCGCRVPRCSLFGGDAPAERCVACLRRGLRS